MNDKLYTRPEFESFHVDYPDSGDSTIDVVEDKVFNHGVLAYKEKSPPSSSHRGLKAFQLSPESPMLIHGDNTPDLGDFPDCDDSRARGYVLHSLELHILSFILGIQYPNLFD
ncbi:hypothetical protein Tco_0014083 [Tanacetum coccineum]